jgi:hypothetical protein
MSAFAKFSRTAQKMLGDAGFSEITPSELHINGVRILLSNRAVECINQQARDAAKPDEPLEALIDLLRALHQHPDAMMEGGRLYKPFINAFAVVQAHTPPPRELVNATEHTMDLPE